MPEELDYHCLKRSLEFLFEQYVPAQPVTAESHPVRLVECAEQRSMTEAQKSLLVALGDLVEATRGFSMEHVLAADSEMERLEACTLSMLRSLFSGHPATLQAQLRPRHTHRGTTPTHGTV